MSISNYFPGYSPLTKHIPPTDNKENIAEESSAQEAEKGIDPLAREKTERVSRELLTSSTESLTFSGSFDSLEDCPPGYGTTYYGVDAAYLLEINKEIEEDKAKAESALKMTDPIELYGVLDSDQHAQSNLQFLVDPHQLPFPDAFNRNLMIATLDWKKANRPNINFVQLFQHVRWLIEHQKERHRLFIDGKEVEALQNPDDPRQELYELARQIRSPKLSEKHMIDMEPLNSGAGGSHVYYSFGEPKAIEKSVNADPGAIDNPKGLFHPCIDSLTRPCKNYESTIKEAFAYELSLLTGAEGTIPPTIMTLITRDNFFTFFDNLIVKKYLNKYPLVKEAIIDMLGRPSTERLCSLQAYAEHDFSLNDLLVNWGEGKYKKLPFNQESFEDNIYITRLLGETDGHSANYLVKEIDGKYHLIKIDNGFSFPKNNKRAMNALTALPNAKEKLSQRYIQKTLETDIEAVVKLAKDDNLDEESIQASRERMEFMKVLVKKMPKITHREFELRLRMFGGGGFMKEIKELSGLKKGDKISLEARQKFALSEYKEGEIVALTQKNRAKFPAKHFQASIHPSSRTMPGGITRPFEKLLDIKDISTILFHKFIRPPTPRPQRKGLDLLDQIAPLPEIKGDTLDK